MTQYPSPLPFDYQDKLARFHCTHRPDSKGRNAQYISPRRATPPGVPRFTGQSSKPPSRGELRSGPDCC